MKVRQVPSVYSEDQLNQYLRRIQWNSGRPEVSLESLTLLMRRHLCNIPFTTSFLCYEDEIPSVDPQEIFERIVVREGGFFCFGLNLLFREILRAIGFRCYSGAARVNRNHAAGGETIMVGQGHMTIYVSLNDSQSIPDDDQLYLVDVGFGGPCQSVPIPLLPGTTRKGPVTEYHRISLFEFPKSSLEKPSLTSGPSSCPLPKLGHEIALEYGSGASPDEITEKNGWNVIYAFSLSEAFADDYAFLHFAHCSLNAFLRDNLISVIYTDYGDDKPLGKVSILNETMRTRDSEGKEAATKKFKTEQERLEALSRNFGIKNIPVNGKEVVRTRKMAIE